MAIMGDGTLRVVIEHVSPEVEAGRFTIKRVLGQEVRVRADVFADGHDATQANLLWRSSGEKAWHIEPMRPLGQDAWEGSFKVERLGEYEYSVAGWVDHFQTWRQDLQKKAQGAQDVRMELQAGAEMVERSAALADSFRKPLLMAFAEKLRNINEPKAALAAALSDDLSSLMFQSELPNDVTIYDRTLRVIADPARALFSAWYELFPRSCDESSHGTLRECSAMLERISEMGFDVVYLPPIHPIGRTHRKGKDNRPDAQPGDPGSPWAIGSELGGHKSIHPDLGTLDDFEAFVKRARALGIDVALDLAYQCSRDHPYLTEHPDWFKWRPDGSIQYAENPPKRYEDVVPFNFETKDWRGLWQELKSIADFWIERGVTIFRVDNPHTKPFIFWEWLLTEVKREHPETIFLSEAFTRPLVKYRLAKIGFTQSYTYFTWRNNKHELIQYMTELTRGEPSEFMRPNFWPNTPDILPQFLQYGGRPAFIIRLALAATLSSNYGIYGPPYELAVNSAVEGKEEYRDSEKYEVRQWDFNRPDRLTELIARINSIRRDNPSLHETNNLTFLDIGNDFLLAYIKATSDLSNLLVIIVNLDPFHTQSGMLRVPLQMLGLDAAQTYLVHDLISEENYLWQGELNFVQLDPAVLPVHILQVHTRLRRENDFDYFM